MERLRELMDDEYYRLRREQAAHHARILVERREQAQADILVSELPGLAVMELVGVAANQESNTETDGIHQDEEVSSGLIPTL